MWGDASSPVRRDDHCHIKTSKERMHKLLISNGGFNLLVSAIVCKLLQQSPLINFVSWNGNHGSSKAVSFLLIKRLNMCSSMLLFSTLFFIFSSPHCIGHVNVVIKQKVHLQNTHWHVLDRVMDSPLLWNRFTFNLYSSAVYECVTFLKHWKYEHQCCSIVL